MWAGQAVDYSVMPNPLVIDPKTIQSLGCRILLRCGFIAAYSLAMNIAIN